MRESLTVLSVVGARPNFMKVAPVARELGRRDPVVRHVLVHTGQHYDDAMSRVFLEELEVPPPHYWLGVGSGTHAQQTARAMERLEPILLEERPDVVLVPGDVNSTWAAALVATKLGIRVGHIQAGLRSYDRTMPEEVNRVLTDQVSDRLFIHSPEAVENLAREGVPRERIHAVGNTMIDTLVAMTPRIESAGSAERYGLTRREYLVVTLHRPALVDGPLLAQAMSRLGEIGRDLRVVFPVHPRTAAALKRLGTPVPREVALIEPLGTSTSCHWSRRLRSSSPTREASRRRRRSSASRASRCGRRRSAP